MTDATNMLSATYLTYICLVAIVTILVARTLSKNGALFLVDSFQGNEALAASVNHLLVVGFYLINLGFALLQLENRRTIESLDQAVIFLSSKIGFVLLVLGAAHFFNLFVISRFKHTQEERTAQKKRFEREMETVELHKEEV